MGVFLLGFKNLHIFMLFKMETFNSRPILLPLATYRSLLKGRKRVVQRLSHPLSFLLSTVFEFELFSHCQAPFALG